MKIPEMYDHHILSCLFPEWPWDGWISFGGLLTNKRYSIWRVVYYNQVAYDTFDCESQKEIYFTSHVSTHICIQKRHKFQETMLTLVTGEELCYILFNSTSSLKCSCAHQNWFWCPPMGLMAFPETLPIPLTRPSQVNSHPARIYNTVYI